MNVCVYMCLWMYIQVNIGMLMYVHICIDGYVCVYVSLMHVYVCVYMYAYMYV